MSSKRRSDTPLSRTSTQLAAVYNKAVYANEVREYVDRLADRLDALEVGGNIVALPRRA